MSKPTQVEWLTEARQALKHALNDAARMPHPSMRGPEVRLIQTLAVAVDGLLDLALNEALNSDVAPTMPSEYFNGRSDFIRDGDPLG